ncbi:MAG: GNAT family N-acetyltransferase [Anaerolineae bacterium]|nr:GNAT family N-acetyltransferase [Anaerolineae bacterium]
MTSILKLTLHPFDLSQIPALHEACWPEVPFDHILDLLSNIVRRCEAGRAWALTALQGGEPVGFGQLSRWTKEAEISDLVVSVYCRSQGIGTALISGLLDIARQQGFREVEIGVAEANSRALALYERLGFEIKRRIEADIGNGIETVLYLRLVLTGQEAT